MGRRVLLAAGLAAAALLAACGSAPATPAASAGATSPGTPLTSPPPASTPTPPASLPAGAIEHLGGVGDLLLRVDVAGGFIAPESQAARVPLFSLYGDGTVLIGAAGAAGAGVTGGGLNPGVNPGGLNPGGATGPVAGTPLRVAHLDEDAVQAVLAAALDGAGLRTAKETYLAPIADTGTTMFEIDAGGVDRTVSVRGLSPDPAPGPDAAAIRRLADLETRLLAIGTTGDYQPPAYIAVLSSAQPDPSVAAAPWPWPDVPPGAFGGSVPKHILTPAQAAALGGPMGPGGAGPFRVTGPDGALYDVRVRPGLPEEVAAT